MAGFQPFAITEFKTGLFQYLQPWIRPMEAFEPLINAYIYRGCINKRAGYIPFGLPNASQQGAGRLVYQDYLATGNGGKTYSGTLTLFPIVVGSFNPFSPSESFTDNGDGTLTGSAGGSGTIVYATGVWTLSFHSNVSSGVNIYANFSPLLATPRPIMGIKTWTNETDGSQKLVVLDTRRASLFNNATNMFTALNSVSQIIWQGDGSTTSITLSTGWVAVSPYTQSLTPNSISITDGTSMITDDGAGNLSSSGNFAPGGTVNYSTGVIMLNFTAPLSTSTFITLTATLTGDYFTGTPANFFNATNWLGYLYLTNNVDRITRFNGTTLDRPPFPITQANAITYTNNIATTLDVQVYKNRLLAIRPNLTNNGTDNGVKGQSIRYSALQNPLDFVSDIVGHGGEVSAPTDDFIQSDEFLRDILVVAFSFSAWIFRFTGSQFDPFRWDKLTVSKNCNAPYGTIGYDERITWMGNKGLVASDGVNVQRYDLQIIDQFLDIQQKSFAQCYGFRYDNLNQGWMLYPSIEDTITNTSVILSDSVLVYNFAENSWSIYELPMNCLGLYRVTKDATWADFASNKPLGIQYPDWAEAQVPWNFFLGESFTPTLLGGGQDGVVYEMDNGVTDNGASILTQITSTQWNPFIKDGQKVQFGYIDFYYEVLDDVLPPIINLSFFVDNSNTASIADIILELDGNSTNNISNFKRVYVNLTGQFVRMTMESSSDANFKINGIILWCRPAGRLTP